MIQKKATQSNLLDVKMQKRLKGINKSWNAQMIERRETLLSQSCPSRVKK